jgi:hypothetical protein
MLVWIYPYYGHIRNQYFARYFPNLPDFRDLRIQLLQASEVDEVIRLLDDIAVKYANQRVDYTNIGLK